MTFSNPITGGQGTLVRPAIKSPDYIPGVFGWSINRNGTAEFNDLIIRGTFFGQDFIISPDGIFFYSGAPAAGNMTGSWAPADGTDEFGNTYTAGLTLYSSVGNVFLGGADGIIESIGASGARVSIEDGQITLDNMTDFGPAFSVQNFVQGNGSWAFVSGRATNAAVPALFQVVTAPGNPTVGNQDTYPRTTTSQQGIGVTAPAYHYVSGAVVKCSADGTASENWIVVGSGGSAPAFGGSFAAGSTNGTYQNLQFRKDAEDNLHIEGVCHTTAAISSAAIVTLPAGYRPAVARGIPVASETSTGAVATTALFLQVNASGQVNLHSNPATAVSQNIHINAVIPLGNLK